MRKSQREVTRKIVRPQADFVGVLDRFTGVRTPPSLIPFDDRSEPQNVFVV
jgi:hypothetical protein